MGILAEERRIVWYGLSRSKEYRLHSRWPETRPEPSGGRRGLSEAELIREALRTITLQPLPARPRLPLFKSGKPELVESVDDGLAGFGDL
jgi:hypothetical protein